MSRNKRFSVQEVCDIVKTCRDNGVSELHYNGLDIILSGYIAQKKFIRGVCDGKAVEEESLIADEHKVRQEQLDEALINDPAGYEQLLIEGELK